MSGHFGKIKSNIKFKNFKKFYRILVLKGTTTTTTNLCLLLCRLPSLASKVISLVALSWTQTFRNQHNIKILRSLKVPVGGGWVVVVVIVIVFGLALA